MSAARRSNSLLVAAQQLFEPSKISIETAVRLFTRGLITQDVAFETRLFGFLVIDLRQQMRRHRTPSTLMIGSLTLQIRLLRAHRLQVTARHANQTVEFGELTLTCALDVIRSAV